MYTDLSTINKIEIVQLADNTHEQSISKTTNDGMVLQDYFNSSFNCNEFGSSMMYLI